MDVAVREQTDEMQLRIFRFAAARQRRPYLRLEYAAVGDGLAYSFRSLRENPACAEGVVTDFAVSHVVVGRKTDRDAVGLEFSE